MYYGIFGLCFGEFHLGFVFLEIPFRICFGEFHLLSQIPSLGNFMSFHKFNERRGLLKKFCKTEKTFEMEKMRPENGKKCSMLCISL